MMEDDGRRWEVMGADRTLERPGARAPDLSVAATHDEGVSARGGAPRLVAHLEGCGRGVEGRGRGVEGLGRGVEGASKVMKGASKVMEGAWKGVEGRGREAVRYASSPTAPCSRT